MTTLVSLAQAATTTTTVAAKSASSGGLLAPIAKPLAEVLAAIYSVVPNYGVAIIGLGIAWMLLISPLTLKSTRSMLAMQKLQPQLKRLQEQHKGDRQAFAQAQMELFREHKVSPFGSCLPMLLPMPVFFALFEVIDGLSQTTKVVVNGVTTVVATPRFLNSGTKMYKAIQHAGGHINAFGMNLAQGALTHHSSIFAAAPYWILLLALAATSYIQSAMMMSRNQASQANPQMKMMKYLAPLFALISVRFPAGVVLYYTVSNLARIGQQDLMYRFDPKVKQLVVREVQEVEEITRSIDEKEASKPGYTPPKAQRPDRSPIPPTPTKRSRFRDLLAAAAEQQGNKAPSPPKAKNSPGATPKPTPSSKAEPRKQPNGSTKARPSVPQGPKAVPTPNGGSPNGGSPNGGSPNKARQPGSKPPLENGTKSKRATGSPNGTPRRATPKPPPRLPEARQTQDEPSPTEPGKE